LTVGGTLPSKNQATDRAFRIGQKNNVFVHKFVALSTLEEHIDEDQEKTGRQSSSGDGVN